MKRWHENPKNWFWRLRNLSPVARFTVWSVLVVIIVWWLIVFSLNLGISRFTWFVLNLEAIRATLGSAFQGLAAFFAIVISISLLVAQLTYGSLSPRLTPNFLKNPYFITTIILFITALSSNLILLSLFSEQTMEKLVLPIILTIFLSLIALISVIPTFFNILNSASPTSIGVDLVNKFNDKYFKSIDSADLDSIYDDILPLLQTLIIKSTREADTDYAQRLLGSFSEEITKHINEKNADKYSVYFNSFFRKIISVASEENEENMLRQIVFINEKLEEKSVKSNSYLGNSEARYEEISFAQNIVYIMECGIKNDNGHILLVSSGAMSRLREIVMSLVPEDAEIAEFRTIQELRAKKSTLSRNTGVHYNNERIFRYIKKTFFESDVSLASRALEAQNMGALHFFLREIFHSRYDLEKLDPAKHKEALSDISFGVFFGLTHISHASVEKGINVANEIAVGIHESISFLLGVNSNLAESYIDLLGELMIEITERGLMNNDPNATLYWVGVALRMSLGKDSVKIPEKILDYFEKVLEIIQEKQSKSSSTMLERMKVTIHQEVSSVKNYADKGVNKDILEKADGILLKYPVASIK